MNYRKIRKNVKALSPIISVLLMIAIAVVASLVVYAWVMGYIGYQTGKTGDSVVIQSVSWNPEATPPTGSYPTAIYAQNIGSTTITIVYGQSYYYGGVLDTAATLNGGTANVAIAPGQTVTIKPSSTTVIPPGTQFTMKVTTLGGTYSQVTETVP